VSVSVPTVLLTQVRHGTVESRYIRKFKSPDFSRPFPESNGGRERQPYDIGPLARPSMGRSRKTEEYAVLVVPSQIDRPIIAPRRLYVKSSVQVKAREIIGPVNSPLTGQSTCLFKCFALFFREVTIGRSTVQPELCA
jgi:hypothetical protein